MSGDLGKKELTLQHLRRGLGGIPIYLGAKKPNIAGWQDVCQFQRTSRGHLGSRLPNVGVLNEDRLSQPSLQRMKALKVTDVEDAISTDVIDKSQAGRN